MAEWAAVTAADTAAALVWAGTADRTAALGAWAVADTEADTVAEAAVVLLAAMAVVVLHPDMAGAGAVVPQRHTGAGPGDADLRVVAARGQAAAVGGQAAEAEEEVVVDQAAVPPCALSVPSSSSHAAASGRGAGAWACGDGTDLSSPSSHPWRRLLWLAVADSAACSNRAEGYVIPVGRIADSD